MPCNGRALFPAHSAHRESSSLPVCKMTQFQFEDRFRLGFRKAKRDISAGFGSSSLRMISITSSC